MADSPLHPFTYDAFQKRALEIINRETSLFVAAPTGSGKTVLADYVIERALREGARVIYTAPIKALSNQKFRDFSARHKDNVGILTGDVSINPAAPLLIMTTEIYRATLLEDPKRLSSYKWIIFDEIHYLDDAERGTVWEEAILFTPQHINLLCLSATIPNVNAIAEWMRTVHKRPVSVIEETHRSVPLHVIFQCQNTILTDLHKLKETGYAKRDDFQIRHHRRRYGRHAANDHDAWHARPNRLHHLVKHLKDMNRLPCIFFTFGRRRAEDLAWEATGIKLVSDEERITLRGLFNDLCHKFQLRHDRSVEALSRLIDQGIAYHHAGMLPTVKEVIERCFTSRLLKLIVTTETFALGVNMPARSVVLDALKKRSRGGYELLRRREFLQMAGRAGRRGMDEAGFVYLRVNPAHVSLPEVTKVLKAEPEPVRSRFNTAYATLLNLYRRHGEHLLDIFPNTLYYFQNSGIRRQAGLDLMRRKLQLLKSIRYIASDGLTHKGEFGSWLYGYELLLTELYADRKLATLDATALAVLLTAIVYEPRPNRRPPKPDRMSKKLKAICEEPLALIHREEKRLVIHPRTQGPAFGLSRAMLSWMGNSSFEQLTRSCDTDEGELVRYFRMVVQLLRQLAATPVAEVGLRKRANKALLRINRDVIDAEAQLRMG